MTRMSLGRDVLISGNTQFEMLHLEGKMKTLLNLPFPTHLCRLFPGTCTIRALRMCAQTHTTSETALT